MDRSLAMDQALQLLPEEVRALVEALPQDEAHRLLQKLLVQSNIEFRALEEKDLQTIKERTTGSCEYGFKTVDVDLTWSELRKQNYIALGAFAEQDGAAVPVAFLVAELVRLPSQERHPSEVGHSKVVVFGVAGPPSPAPGPLRATPGEVRAAMHAAGCPDPHDLAVAVWYIGVSYEYRRQGLGSRLLDLVREVGEAAGARSMWLHVADYNPSAITFYTRYGFTACPEVFKQGERGRHVLMHMPLQPGAVAEEEQLPLVEASQAAVSRGFAGRSSGGANRGKKKAKAGKRRALVVGTEDMEVGREWWPVVSGGFARGTGRESVYACCSGRGGHVGAAEQSVRLRVGLEAGMGQSLGCCHVPCQVRVMRSAAVLGTVRRLGAGLASTTQMGAMGLRL